ncbi:isochorismatase family protein [Bordetella bronchiseptica]|uniref:isochorismatase family protein n=1 Tax=Bordetella bronchiseptica TaxID=518 RepID=UPI00049EF468|nr:isochorismatase family protein [Bordetella bronchiseptica]KDD96492.1 isochorismatase family protein [Bordetella bronchiseptica MO275]
MKLPVDGLIASFDVDAQKSFTPLCPDELPVPDGHAIVPELNAQAAHADLRLGSKDAHSPHAIWRATADQPMFSPVAGANVDVRWNMHCVPGTRGFELLDGLPAPAAYDFFVWKGVEPDMHPYGSCYHDLAERQPTGVIEFLRARDVRYVLVGGLALDYCVKVTALQLRRAGLEVVVNLAACRGIAAATCEQARRELSQAGVRTVPHAGVLVRAGR